MAAITAWKWNVRYWTSGFLSIQNHEKESQTECEEAAPTAWEPSYFCPGDLLSLSTKKNTSGEGYFMFSDWLLTCHNVKEEDGLGQLMRAGRFSLSHGENPTQCVNSRSSYHSLEVQSFGQMGLQESTRRGKNWRQVTGPKWLFLTSKNEIQMKMSGKVGYSTTSKTKIF